jgi:hypothetical protein
MSPHQIAYSIEHDGPCEVEHEVTFHEATGETRPAFTRYRLSWTDALGCRHFVRYDLLDAAERIATPKLNEAQASDDLAHVVENELLLMGVVQ